MAKLTNQTVVSAKVRGAGKETLLGDGNGLALRVKSSGAKAWVFRYRHPATGKQDKMTFATFPEKSLKEARGMIQKFREQLDKGIDPKQAKAAERAENAAVLTMGELFGRWIEYFEISGGKAPRTVTAHRWRWGKYLKADLQNIRLPDLTRAHLASTLDKARKNTKRQTAESLTTLRLMLDYALARHLIDENPARLLRPSDFNASASKPRERALSLVELRALWKALDEKSAEKEGEPSTRRLSPTISTAIKLLIITGARRTEVTALCWRELDFKVKTWTLPAERSKNRKAHTFYLPEIAVTLLEDLKPLTGHSEYVFESDRTPDEIDKPVAEASVTRALVRLRQNEDDELSKLEPFTLHDLRRSAATAWAEHLKVDPHIIERMLNHQPENRLIGTYQRAAYVEEQKAAWTAWGELIAHSLARDPSNITLISASKKKQSG